MASEKLRCENCGRLTRYEAKGLKSPMVDCPVCHHATAVEARAVAKFVITAPRKLRLIADAIRGKNVNEALTWLRFAQKRAAKVVSGVVASAKANAETAYQMNPDNLIISTILIDGGPVLKRFMPRAMGRAAMVRKRTSHITVKVREPISLEKTPKTEAVSQATAVKAPPAKAKPVKAKKEAGTTSEKKKSVAAKAPKEKKKKSEA